MPTLSSRPDLDQDYSDADLLDAIRPAINVLDWLSAKTALPDNTAASGREGKQVIEEVLSCFGFEDYTVLQNVSPIGFFLYDVAVKPFNMPVDKFVTFRLTLRVKP